jgi:hypothetical protein
VRRLMLLWYTAGHFLMLYTDAPMLSGSARLMRSFVLRWVRLPLLVLVLAVRVLVSPVTCNNSSYLPYCLYQQ